MTARLLRYVRLNRFHELTGYTEKAVYEKIRTGAWIEGRQYRRAPDRGRLLRLWVARVREPIFMPAPRYRIVDLGSRIGIQLHHRTIAHANVYDTAAGALCVQMVQAANVASEVRVALKECAAAFLTMEHCGIRLPEPVLRVKDRAFAALAATQR